jgi:hypothetical protein
MIGGFRLGSDAVRRLAASLLTGVNNKARPVPPQLPAARCLGQTGMGCAHALTQAAPATMVGGKPVVPTFATENMDACRIASLESH